MILSADSISKSYRGAKVLTSASLTVGEGSVVGLLGRVGAGKSTLMKICAGLVTPDSGWVRFGGTQYLRPQLHKLAGQGLFYLPERNGLSLGLTLRQHFAAVERRFGANACDEIIELLRLQSIIDAFPESLSGGEERRASLAVALVRKPRCLVIDEPLRSVDPILAELLGTCLRQLVWPYLDSVVWMTAGTTCPLGSPDLARRNERFRREYLGEAAATEFKNRDSRISAYNRLLQRVAPWMIPGSRDCDSLEFS